MAKGQEVSTFPVILLAGLTVFGLVFVADQGIDFNLNGEQERDRVVMVSQSFGKVGDANQDFRNIGIRDFTVGETRGDIQAYTARKAELKGELFGGETVTVNYNATSPRTGSIEFEVLGRSGNGAVFVKSNGEKVWEEKLVASGTPEITVPASELKPGMNTIEIGATRGGIIASTTYTIEDLEVTVNDRKFHDFTDTFQVYDYEVQDFVEGQLSFDVRSSVKNQPLKVNLNGNEIYSRRQVRVSPETVTINPENADLHVGYNTITFETDGESEYSIENPQITLRYLGSTEEGTIRKEFSLNRSALDFAEREDTQEKIVFDYQRLLPSPREMRIYLNGNRHTLTPKSGQNTVEFEAEELKEENELVIRSDATYKIDQLELISEKSEDEQ